MKKRFAPQTLAFFSLFILLIATVVMTKVVSNINESRVLSSNAADSGQFVTRNDTKFFLGNNVFNFVGFNLFDAAGAQGPYSCLETNKWFAKFTSSELDSIMKQMKSDANASVLRFWAFQKYTKGGTDFSGIDNVIQLAKANGLKVIPVLEDGQGYCTEPGGGGNNHIQKWQYNNDTWYTTGYKSVNTGYSLSYRDYVAKIVDRYKNEPAILGWMMMNEADTSLKVSGKSSLVNFASDMGTLIKSIDQNHLVTVGTQSNGASGATGQDFLEVYGLSVIDFAEAHDWGYWGSDTEAIPGGTKRTDGNWDLPDPNSPDCLKTYKAKIGCSMAQAIKTLKKPMLIGEVGIAATDANTRVRRASLMEDKLKAFFTNGGAGMLYWQWNHVLDAEHFDVLGNTSDPLLPVMKKYSGFVIPPVVTSSPTLKPTVKPTATVLPTPTSKVTPIATAKPTTVPSTTPSGSLSLEGELFRSLSGKNDIIADKDASSSKTMYMQANGMIEGRIIGTIKTITVRAKAETCAGYPHINVKIDGRYALDQNVTLANYTNYKSNNIEWMKLGSGTHTVQIIYGNDATYSGCSRNVLIDRIVLE